MKIIISPAKRMRIQTEIVEEISRPRFLSDALKIKDSISRLTRDQLKELLNANDAITDLNFRRYREMDISRGLTPAVLSYAGLQYQSMAPDIFTTEQWTYVKRHLKILSGLYGILDACDGVTPYRLEMQAGLQLEGTKNLYGFWGSRICEALCGDEDAILNLASKEYSKSVEPYLPAGLRFISCIFAEESAGKVKVKATMAKIARGDMVRWMAENQVTDPETVKQYRNMGYRFCPDLSGEDKWFFVRERN